MYIDTLTGRTQDVRISNGLMWLRTGSDGRPIP